MAQNHRRRCSKAAEVARSASAFGSRFYKWQRGSVDQARGQPGIAPLRRAWLCALSLLFVSSAHADCPAAGPLAVARWIQHHRYDFYAEVPDDAAAFISGDLLDLLGKEWACREVCAVDADPWTGAQDGEVLPPLSFDLEQTSDDVAAVVMSYQFGWPESNAPAAVSRQTRLELTRDRTDRCWKLVDIVADPNGTSLLQSLRQHHTGGR